MFRFTEPVGRPPGLPSPPASVKAAKSDVQAAVQKALPTGVPKPGLTPRWPHRYLRAPCEWLGSRLGHLLNRPLIRR